MTRAFFDLGTTCGYAVGEPGNIMSGDFDNAKRAASHVERLINFDTHIKLLHSSVRFDAVAYEEVAAHKGTTAAHWYGSYKAVLLIFCWREGIPVEGVAVGTLKRFWAGKGNADKRAMIAAARQRGFEPASDNEADALAGLHWMFAQSELLREAAE